MTSLRLILTQTLCARARPEPREYALHDTRQAGLSLRIHPSGAKSWIVRTRNAGKVSRRLIGTFPEHSVREARLKASATLLGNVPPPPAPAAPLFRIFQPEHEIWCAATYKPSGFETYRSYMRAALLPTFGRKCLDKITRADVQRWFEHYSATSPGGANRALGILRQTLGYAKAQGYLPDDWRNPASGIRQNPRRPVGTFLSREEMQRLGPVLEAHIDQGCAVAALLKFLALTGCRISEAVHLEWRDVLPDRLRLRDSKTGARDVILGKPVRRMLAAHRSKLPPRARNAGAPVFPLTGGQRYESVRSIWHTVRREAQIRLTLRIHDLRHSFASHAVMSGETLFSTSRLLGHRRVQMTARYAHLADTALLNAAERIGSLLQRAKP
jgi:integrase